MHYRAHTRNRHPTNVSPPARYAHCASVLLTLPLLLVTFQTALAQEQEPVDEVVRVRTDLITVPLFVTDKEGRRIAGLRQQDFVLRDNGREMETAYFSSGSDRVALLFALDASGSARDIIARQREAALALFSRFGKDSRVAVMRFTETTALAASFAMRPGQALEAFNFPALPGRRTAIFDAAMNGVRSFDMPDKAERRIVVLISDGLDTASKTGASKVIGEAIENGVSFYVIHLPLFEPRDGRLRVRPPSKGFRDLAEKTGGKYFMLGDAKTALSPSTQHDLTPVFRAIEEDLRGQYLLGYYPVEASRDDLPHRIEVSITGTGNRKLRVRVLRSGYVLKKIE
ncbi:MAG TPA: VWA domain-containing protein [Pyrinomonadaceae bacterium]|nr:VWA domain-containing protein [Pyrinomonadaceae bacterium]